MGNTSVASSIEGQSGTGKTTCVRHILAELKPDNKPVYLTARNPVHVSQIEKIARDQAPGQYVIDDFHRLAQPLQESLADVAKLSADLGPDGALPKLIIIGINQIGSELIQLVPDIAKRTGIHRIAPGTEASINMLVRSGSEALNIYIKDSAAPSPKPPEAPTNFPRRSAASPRPSSAVDAQYRPLQAD